MHVSAQADYAVRALIELAAADGKLLRGEQLAAAQQIPSNYLFYILQPLRAAGMVQTQRGTASGYRLGRPPDSITVAEIIRVVNGPLANVRGEPPEQVTYRGSAQPLRAVWIAVRASLRRVLEEVTIGDLVRAELPTVVRELVASPAAWQAATSNRRPASLMPPPPPPPTRAGG